jgi:hypothetical protein
MAAMIAHAGAGAAAGLASAAMRPRAIAVLAALAVTLTAPAFASAKLSPRVLADVQADGHLSACRYTDAQLARARASIPADLARSVPGIDQAIRAAQATHARGACPATKKKKATLSGGAAPARGTAADDAVPEAESPSAGAAPSGGAAPSNGSAPSSGAGGAPSVSSPPAAGTTAPATTPTTPAVAAAPPAAAAPTPRHAPARDSSGPAPWLVVLAALGLLVLLAGAAAATARALGREPRWAAPARHAWAEAGYRAGNTWGDFVDWLRLGR